MAKYMGKSSDEIWKLVMGDKQQSGQQEQPAAQTSAKASTSGGRYAGMSSDEILQSVMAKTETDEYQNYQGWLKSYDKTATKYHDYSVHLGGAGRWQADAFGGTKSEMEDLLGRYDEIYNGLDDYDKKQFQKSYNGLKKTYDYLTESSKFYAQYKDQADYDRARSGYGNFGVGYAAEAYGLDDASARKLRQEAAQKDAQEAQRALAEYVSAKKAFTPVEQEYRIHNKGDSDGGAYSDEYEEDLNSRYNQARAKVTAAENALLSARNRMDAYNATWGKIDQYAKYADAAKGEDTSYTGASFDEIKNYEYKLENEPIHSDREALAPAEAQDKYLSGWLAQNPEPNMDDSLGLWLSMTEEQREQAAQSTFPALQTLANTANDGLWDQLNDTEIQTYYYLRHNQGQEAALQYLKDLNPELNRRTDEAFIETVQNASTAGRWGYEAAAYGLNLIGNVEAGVGELGEMITGNHNPYSNTSRAQRYAGYIRGINGESVSAFVQDVAKNAGASEEFVEGAAKYAENTYQAVTSGIDSAIGAAVFGHAYLPVMGLGAMAQKSSELELQGATNRQIAVGAIGAGCIEMLFEKVSLDHFFDNFIKTPPKSWKELVAKTLVQAGIEGSEEINTEIANIAFDAINMGKNCDVSMAVRGYMLQGMTEEEAKKKAMVDAVTDIYWAGFGGFVSGGAMAGFSGTVNMGLNKTANVMGNYAVGDTLTNNGRYVDLQEQANALQNQKKGAKLAKAAQEVAYNASVGDVSPGNKYRMGKVATQIAQQAGREASKAEMTEFRAAAEKYLAGQRDIQHKKLALNVLTRAYEGTTMVPGDRAYIRMIQGDKLTQNILDSIGGKETLQENAKAREAASMRTAASVQGSVLGLEPTQERAAYDSDNSGQAYLKDSKDPVNIRGIAEVRDGQMYVATDEGQTVKASDVSFGSYGEAALYSAISNMHTDTQKARSLLYGLDSSGMSTQAYATALQNAYNKGMSGVSYEGIQDYSYAAKLSDDVRRQAWEAGKDRRAVKTGERAAKVDSGTLVNREKGLTIQDSAKEIVRDSGKMNEQQRAGVAAAKVLAEAGLHIEVYASTESERQNGAPNGIYRSSDGTIHIDLNAGDNGQGTVAYALAHETTHFIKDFSLEKYQTYADILIEAAESKGISYDSLLDRQLAKQAALEENRGKSAEELQKLAYDETIAEMSETMLTDTDAAQRVSQELYKQDRTLWEKIRDFFTGLVEKLKNAYKGVDPDSDIGRVMKRAISDNEKVAQAWAEAVVEAGENYQLQDGTVIGTDGNSADYLYSNRVTDKKTLDFLDGQETVTTYKTMQLVDGKLYPPMAAVVAGSYEDYSELGKWEAATEHPELIKLDKSGKPKFTLNKGKGQGSLAAAYNPYMHSSNLVLNDQFSGAYTRPNLVTVECRVPVSELTSGYKAQYAKDSVGWHSWHTGTVAGALRQQTGTERQVLLSRWIMPVRIVPNAEVAQMYKQLLDGTDIAVPDNVVPPALLTELKKAGVTISESGRIQDGQKNNARAGERFSLRTTTDGKAVAVVDEDILSGIDLTQWNDATKKAVKAAAKEALKSFEDGIVVDGVTRKVNKTTRKEYTGSNYSEKLAKKLPTLYVDKMRAAGALDDIVIATTDWARDGKLVHPRTDNFVDFDHGNVLIETDGHQYSAEVVVGITDKGEAVFYDVVDIQPASFTLEKQEPSTNVTTNESPDAVHEGSLVDSIRKSSRNVNSVSENQTETENFKKWFGDWQNDPAKASKVVNADGTPKVVYHGTNAEFTVFDSPNGTYWFSESSDYAESMAEERGGNELMQAFLDIKNPYYAKLAPGKFSDPNSEAQIIRKAKTGGYDGVVIEADTTNELLKDTFYVVFSPEQIKSATDNVGTFDKGNPDIRYSSRNNQESQVERLARKNEELKAEAEYLKQVVQIQKRGNTRNLRDRESVNAIAKSILESVNAKDTEFGKKLNDFYRDMVTVEMDYDTMQERAGELADRVLEHHQAERDGYAQEVLDFLKKRRVSLTDSQIGDAEYTYGSLNEFKKAIKGSIIIDQNSTTSLDQLWQEAAAQFPDRFSAETVAADMPDGIANVVSWATNAEADSETEFQYYKAETKADLTQKILMGFLDAKPIESVSDTLKQQMEDLKKQHQQEMKELRKSWDAEAKAMEQSHKYDLEAERKRGKAAVEALKYQQEVIQKAQKGLWETERADIKRSYEKQMKELREQNTQKAHEKVESRHRTEERHKLQNTVDTLNRLLLKPTNTAHVPQELQSSVAMAMKVINGVILDSKAGQNADRLAKYAEQLRTLEENPEANAEKIADLNRKINNLTGQDISMKAALNSLQEQYAKLEGQEGSLYDSNIEALIEDARETIGDTAYKDLSLGQLKAVRDTYTALLTTIRNANKAFVAGQNARIDEMVKRATMELSLKDKKKPTQTAMGKKIDQFFWNNEKPVYAFERIGSAVMSELYNNLRKGEDTFYRDVNSARDFFLEAAKKNGFDKWDLNELQEFEASNGQKFQLSLDERMSLYAYSLRPQAREHLTRGGIVLAENTKRLQRGPLGVTMEVTYDDANAYTLTDETIDAIAGSLTKEQRQFAFEMQQYLAKIMGAKGDEVNMALYGIKKFGEETYWPLKSSGVFSERIREQQERTGNKVKNKGFTKALTEHANNAIELASLTETWAEHVNDMSMYHAFTLPMEDFYRVYNWTQKGDTDGKRTMGVRQMIQQTAGKGAVTYIDQFLKDLNGGLRADPRETVEKALVSSFKKAAVGASLSVAIQQPSAVGRAFAYIEANYFLGGKVESAGGIKQTWDQLKKYAAVAGLKEMGRFDVDMGQSTLEYIIGRHSVNAWGKFKDKVDEYSGWLPEMADQVTWCAIWEAAKRKTAAQNPGLKGEALLQKAGELFTDTITRTQVYDSVFSRSSSMRAKTGLMSMVTSFMAEPTTTANMVEDAVRKFARGDKRMAGKVMSSVAVATVLNAALASVVYAARDDDEDKTYWEKYLASLAGETVDSFNPLTYIPVLADINNLLLGYSIERTDMALASDLVTDLKKIYTLYKKFDPEWSDEKKEEWKKKVRDAWLDNAWMVGTVMGLPLKNVVRDVEAVINTAKNPSNGAEMSADTVLKAMKDSARKNFPILSWKADESSSDQLYKAIIQGKDVLAKRLKAQFGDEKKYESALLKGLRENDPRIKEAAQYAIDGNTPKRVAIIREIVAEGHYTQDQVIKAINQKANSMKEKTQSGKESPPEKLYDYSEYVNAAANGLGYAGDVQKELIRYQADRNQEADGKLTRQEAESDALKTFQSNVKGDAKDGYAAGELTEAQVRKVLTAADIAEDEELDDLILQWDTELELGDEISWSNARYLDYAETIHPAGISADTYDSYIRAVSKLSSIDEDGDGKEDITKQEQVIEYIDSMPISDAQKDTLFQAEYPKARKSVLRKLPWR